MEQRQMPFTEFQNIACEHTPDIAEDSEQPEWTQGELRKLYDDLCGKGVWSSVMNIAEIERVRAEERAKVCEKVRLG